MSHDSPAEILVSAACQNDRDNTDFSADRVDSYGIYIEIKTRLLFMQVLSHILHRNI